MLTIKGDYFYGNKISEYGIQNGRVDYRTLAKSFDAVLNNDIMQKTWEIGYWEQESGFVNNEEEIEELKEQIEELEEKIEELEENEEENKAEIESTREEIERLEAEIENLENDYPSEIYQYYIVDDNGAELLKEVEEIVFYNEELDMYIWGVTHWGTSWDYVLTNIKIEKDEDEE